MSKGWIKTGFCDSIFLLKPGCFLNAAICNWILYMKIVLVFPPFYLDSMYNLPPLGLINIATMAKNPNRDIIIHDFVLAIRNKKIKMSRTIYDDCAKIVLGENPDLVGFSAQCTTYPGVIRIAEKIKKESPETKIVIGGHNASFVAQETLAGFPFIDAVVKGEGEITFQELVTAYENGLDEAGVAGVTYRSHGKIIQNKDRKLIEVLDDLPMADYSFVRPFSEYSGLCGLPRSIAILEVGRGCPHRCIYCSESVMWQQKTRTFSINRLVKEMRHLHENYNAQCFLLAYDQFTAKKKFVEDFCTLVIEEKLNHLPWYCISRLDTVDPPLLRRMREAGCESMCYGIDSGSKKTLAFIRKKIDEDILYERVKETTKQGIVPTLSFIIGFPNEEKEDIDATMLLALRTGVQGNSNPLVQMPTVLPGTDLHKFYKDKLVRGVDTYFSLGLEFDNGSRLALDDKIINSDPSLFSSFYNLACPGRSLEELNIIASYFPLIINLYPKSFLLLTIALKESASDLFIKFFNWMGSNHLQGRPHLTHGDCFRNFSEFADQTFKGSGIKKWSHFQEMVKYETVSLKAGKFSHTKQLCYTDLPPSKEIMPMLRENVIISDFEYNIREIIEDLNMGIFNNQYAAESVSLIFRFEDNELEVTEINDFGKDFLGLCDGSARLKEIVSTLYPVYGSDMERNVFVKECEEAMTGLSDLRLLQV